MSDASTFPLRGTCVALVALASAACSEPWPDPPPVDAGVFATEHADFREYRQGRLVTPPGGAVLWIGLWALPDGEVRFGSDPSLPIVLIVNDRNVVHRELDVPSQLARKA